MSRRISICCFVLSAVILGGCASTQKAVVEEEVGTPVDTAQVAAEQRMMVKLHFSTGYEYYKNEMFDDAITPLTKVIELDPQHKSAYSLLADSFFRTGRNEEAEEIYQRAIDQFPEDAAFYNSLGYLYEQEGRIDEAIVNYQEATRLSPENCDIHLRLARLYLKNYRELEALGEYEAVCALQPENESVNEILSRLYLKHGMAEKRLEAYQRLHESKPDDVQTTLNLGKAYAELDRFQESVDVLVPLVEGGIDEIRAYIYLAAAYHGLEKYDLAIKYSNEAQKIDPQNPKIYCDLASSYTMKGNTTKAEEYVRKALTIDKNYAYAFICMGEIEERRAKPYINSDGKVKYEGKLHYKEAYSQYKKALDDPLWGDYARKKLEFVEQFLPTEEDEFFHRSGGK